MIPAHVLNQISAAEGGYSNDLIDAGGETIAGISRRHWPDWPGWRLVDEMKTAGRPVIVTAALRPLIAVFYEQNFYLPMAGPHFPVDLAGELTECAVNCGVRTAGRILQEALNLLGADPALELDGILGPATRQAVIRELARNRGLHFLVLLLNRLQAEHYINIVRKHPEQGRFLRGWLTRT